MGLEAWRGRAGGDVKTLKLLILAVLFSSLPKAGEAAGPVNPGWEQQASAEPGGVIGWGKVVKQYDFEKFDTVKDVTSLEHYIDYLVETDLIHFISADQYYQLKEMGNEYGADVPDNGKPIEDIRFDIISHNQADEFAKKIFQSRHVMETVQEKIRYLNNNMKYLVHEVDRREAYVKINMLESVLNMAEFYKERYDSKDLNGSTMVSTCVPVRGTYVRMDVLNTVNGGVRDRDVDRGLLR
jgi:hypothetical protein